MMSKSHWKVVEENCVDNEYKRDLLFLMQNICEENEFVCANYYVPIKKTNKLTCANQPYVVKSGIEGLEAFQIKSTEIEHLKGKGLVGRVSESQEYEWNKNVQFAPSDQYQRKFHAVDAKLCTCLGMAHIENHVFKGVFEFFLMDEWYEVYGMVEKVKFYLQN